MKCNQNDHKIINELKNASNLLKENISSKDIEKIINYIKNIFVNITFEENDLNYKDKLLGFFVEFNKNVESFNCIKDIKYSDIENIYDFFLDIDEDEITNSDLEEFVKVIRFLNNDINKSKNQIDLINNLINGILNDKKCGNCLKNTLKKIDKINDVLEKISKGEEGCFTKIKRILEKSNFEIIHSEKEDRVILNGSYEKNYLINTKKKLDLSVILENKNSNKIIIEEKDLDALYQKAFISKKNSNIIDNVKFFINLYKEMTKIKNLYIKRIKK